MAKDMRLAFLCKRHRAPLPCCAAMCCRSPIDKCRRVDGLVDSISFLQHQVDEAKLILSCSAQNLRELVSRWSMMRL